MRCKICQESIHKSITNKIQEICDCSQICESCFLEKYVIYNYSPIKVERECKICGNFLNEETSQWIFQFTVKYFSTEGPTYEYYLF